MLIAAGADLTIKTKSGRTIESFIHEDDKEIMQQAIENGTGKLAAHFKARQDAVVIHAEPLINDIAKIIIDYENTRPIDLPIVSKE